MIELPPDLGYLWLPLAACLILTGIHCYLGIHVIARQVIFVDLALAQIAALGATVALLAGHPLSGRAAYFTALGFACAGAAVLAATRVRRERVPQEALIGIVYAVASAAAIVAVSAAKDPHGAEHIKDLLAGNIILVDGPQVAKTLGIYSLIGLFHALAFRQMYAISFEPERAFCSGMRVRLWDFLFYVSFAFVITSSVQLAGVLLVFAYLIVPAVIASLFFDTLRARLFAGWLVGGATSFVGLLLSYNLPAGPVLVCLFGVLLVLCGLYRFVSGARRPGVALLQVLLVAGLCAGAIWLLVLAARWEHEHPGHHHHDEPHESEPPRKLERRQVERFSAEVEVERLAAKGDTAGLEALWPRAQREPVRLKIALALAARGRTFGLEQLVWLLRHAKTPGARLQALGVLQPLAGGDLGYDPLEPDGAATARWESWWQASRGKVRWNAARGRFQLGG